jgi:DNA-binding response OmpR family regulator
MSGYAFANADTASPDFLRMTLELGATCCLRKPFTPKALLAAVNDCLSKPMVKGHLQEK